MAYNPEEIEQKWQDYWKENNIYQVKNGGDRPKYYVLDMFPYPSGAGLHVGHPLGYIASDIYSRYKRLKGFNVLHPMGFDAFGLPAEEYAIQTGIHPAVSTRENMTRYRGQLSKLGFSFDWSREIATCDPKYYKWTQWIFKELFNHYYDIDKKISRPIKDLTDQFNKDGNLNILAANSLDTNFSKEEWMEMSDVEQAEILMHYRLAYRKEGYVNWCEELGTVLANDQIKDGLSERGGHPVVQKAMTQWALRTTAYADRLLDDLETIDWSDSLKTIQTNWIGRSKGASISFSVDQSDETIEIFTTRPDTIFGATYMVLAPEHDLVPILTTSEHRETVNEYLSYVNARSEIDRMAEKEISGVFIGAYALHPFNGERIPIWIGEYVLKDYGTGAIMAVPSDDERDHKFATKFNLPIIPVVDKSGYPGSSKADKIGKLINSDFLNDMEVQDAIDLICTRVEELGIGQAQINYRMRDANFSRQRYWGEPFPIKYNSDGIASVLSDQELPLELPDTDDFKPGLGGQSPLSRMKDWTQLPDGYSRETDTMPAVAGSSWYFLRYMDPNNEDEFACQAAINYWQDVDLYVGGAEHAVAHLMYARFWHKFLFDKGLVPTNEPFKKLINQGMIQGIIEFVLLQKEHENDQYRFMCAGLVDEDDMDKYARIPIHIDYVKDYGTNRSYLDFESLKKFTSWRPTYKNAIFECSQGIYQDGIFTPKGDGQASKLYTHSEVGKMSKRFFNVVNPDDVIANYGTDCFRMYEMFLGPIEQSKPWDTNGIDGVFKFIKKYWNLFFTDDNQSKLSTLPPTPEELKILHTCIKKVNHDIERFSFNTCVSSFMICVNELTKLKTSSKQILDPLTRLLAPFAPHVTEEIWRSLGHTDDSIHKTSYPIHNEEYLIETVINYPISINGKKRGEHQFDADATKEEIEQTARGLEVVIKWSEGKTIRKIIIVPNKMVNVVVG